MFEFLVRFVDKLLLINQLGESGCYCYSLCFIWLSNLCHLGFYLIGAFVPLAILTALLSTTVTYGCLIQIMHVSQLSKLSTPGKIPESRVHGSWLGRMQIVTWFSWGMIS